MGESAALADDMMSRLVVLNAKATAISNKAQIALRRAEIFRNDLHNLKADIDRMLASPLIERESSPSIDRQNTTPIRASSSPLIAALNAIGLDAASLPDLTEDLCAAYQRAQEDGDEDQMRIFGAALRHIGQHYAAKIGPRAAGVAVN